jgi:hypothetical protein
MKQELISEGFKKSDEKIKQIRKELRIKNGLENEQKTDKSGA